MYYRCAQCGYRNTYQDGGCEECGHGVLDEFEDEHTCFDETAQCTACDSERMAKREREEFNRDHPF